MAKTGLESLKTDESELSLLKPEGVERIAIIRANDGWIAGRVIWPSE